ncbi:MAG: NAD(P)-dependent oxidoreductase [Saprospiraceae bacterium]
MKRLLITGVSSFLGSYLIDWLPMGWRTVGTYYENRPDTDDVPAYRIDLTDRAQLDKILERTRPDAILHVAAASNPNWCEQNETLSYHINVQSTQHLAEYAATHQIPFIYTSTDLVFDGAHAPYAEDAQPQPISIYGHHKLMAEQVIQATYEHATIARLPLLYGMPRYGNNFFTAWLEKLQTGQVVGAFTDEFRTPVDGESAARGLFILLHRGATGVYHLGGRERLSRYDFAVQMAETFRLPISLVKPALRAQVQMAAARPQDVSLSSEKAFQLGYAPATFLENLQQMMEEV